MSNLTIKIQVLNVSVNTGTTKTGKPFQTAEVAYKNLTNQGKVESKKVTEYVGAFKAAAQAAPGQVYDVMTEKKGEFREWVSMDRVLEGQSTSAPESRAPASTGGATTTQYKSTYETPEERAKKQVYIVKQSSLSVAAHLRSVGAKTPPALDDVIADAQKLVDWVLDEGSVKPAPDLFDQPNDID
jgi:hypothetical protein